MKHTNFNHSLKINCKICHNSDVNYRKINLQSTAWTKCFELQIHKAHTAVKKSVKNDQHKYFCNKIYISIISRQIYRPTNPSFFQWLQAYMLSTSTMCFTNLKNSRKHQNFRNPSGYVHMLHHRTKLTRYNFCKLNQLYNMNKIIIIKKAEQYLSLSFFNTLKNSGKC